MPQDCWNLCAEIEMSDLRDYMPVILEAGPPGRGLGGV